MKFSMYKRLISTADMQSFEKSYRSQNNSQLFGEITMGHVLEIDICMVVGMLGFSFFSAYCILSIEI